MCIITKSFYTFTIFGNNYDYITTHKKQTRQTTFLRGLKSLRIRFWVCYGSAVCLQKQLCLITLHY